MKKIIAVLLAVLMVGSLAGCGGSAPATAEEVKGTVTNAGKFSMLVPDGWLGIPTSDLFDEYEGDTDPTTYSAYKGAKKELDAFSKPGVQVKYYPPETSYWSAKGWYDDAKDIDPITVGGRTWIRYTCSSLDYPLCIWETGEDGGDQFVITEWLDNGDKSDKLTPDDVEVQAIAASITLN